MLVLRELAIGYHSARVPVVVVRGLTAELRRGELTCLLGPNGVGKSTLLLTVSGALVPLGGRVSLDGVDVHAMPASLRARRMAVVFTERSAAPLLTAEEFVALGRHPHTDWLGRLTVEDRRAVAWALDATASVFAHRPVSELSDGERQRVVVARALAQEPALLLLDEVTAFLDLPHRVHMMRMLRRLAHRTGQAVLLSTHDLDLALRGADRVWLLSSGTLSSGAPEDLVLSGAFEAAFAAHDVSFDRRSGAFRLHAEGGPVVTVAGEGDLAEWTRRALERMGSVADRSGQRGPVHVDVIATARSTRWEVLTPAGPRTAASIEELVAQVREAIEVRTR
jgi:cobalamin transport system ATP-binding protein